MFRQMGLMMVAVAVAALLPALPARASFESTTTIDAAVTNFLDSQGLAMRARGVDPRLKLKTCTAPLDIARHETRHSLTVRCPGADTWRIFVTLFEPTPVLADNDADRPLVVTLKTSLPRGALISAQDLHLAPAPRAMTSAMLRQTDIAIGQKLRQSVTAGTPLKLTMLERAPTVRKGDRVALRAVGKSFSVQVEGIAKQDGTEGDRVTVVNLSSGERLSGRINSEGAILISF